MQQKEKKAFSLISRVGSFKHAFRGLGIFIADTHNAWVEIVSSFILVMMGFYFHISMNEWFVLIISIGVLITTEAINTAIEVDINLTSPKYHPFARDTKDIAAGAVLLVVFTFLIIASLIFIPRIIALLTSYT